MRRLLALAATTVLLAAGALTGAAPAVAQNSPITSCTSTTGTIMAVDYHHWGGPIVRGCDLGKPAHSNNLFDDLGFTHVGTQHDGPYFICRIGNAAYAGGTQYPRPNEAGQSCNLTPPASAYWSFWVAPAGQNSWSYSQLGAYSYEPKAGEVQLWIFGGTHIKGSQGDPVDGFPTCSPSSLRAGGNPTSCTPAPQSGSGGGGSTGGGSGNGGNGGTGNGGSGNGGNGGTGNGGAGNGGAGHQATTGPTAGSTRSTAPRPSTRRTTARATTTTRRATSQPSTPRASTSSPSSSGAPAAVEAKPASSSHPLGSATGLIVGLGLVAVLAIGGGVTLWRRRRTD